MQYSDLIFEKKCHVNDCAYFFRIDNNYNGHTRDYNLFHVLNKNTNAYTSYTRSEFENFLQNKDAVIPVSSNNNGSQNSGLSKFNDSGFGTGAAIAVGVILFVILIIMQK